MQAVPVLTIQDLLRAGRVDLPATRLVRHRETRFGRAMEAQLRHAALRLDGLFLDYQAFQSGDVFAGTAAIASFVGDPVLGTVFVGVWHVRGAAPATYRHPLDATRSVDGWRYDLEHRPDFDDYRGRLCIAWGAGQRSWVQRAARMQKPITLLLPRSAPPFPGWSRLHVSLAEVPGLPDAWQAVLRASRGVYLLVHRPSGSQYVGAALGVDGFLGRWLAYADGTGGNVGLQKLQGVAEDYDASVLWVASSRDGDDDVLVQESFEKTRLGSRVHGLNLN